MRPIKLSIEKVESCYHMPLIKAAEELNVGTTNLKIFLRQNGIQRWPYRKFNSLYKAKKLKLHDDNFIDNLLNKLKKNPNLHYRTLISQDNFIKKLFNESAKRYRYEKKAIHILANISKEKN